MKQFAVFVQSISRSLDFIAGFCIVATMAVVVLNIVLRAFLGKPLLGTMDYVTMLMALTIGMGLAYCGFKNGHIAVDLIIEKLSNKTQAIIDTFTNLIALFFWGVSSWYMVGYARTMAETNLVSPTTQIPLYPLIYLISFGLMVLCLVLVLKITDTVRQVTK
jgi:TRAP-type C4-dicarboxylate transport system permease small subunit